MKKILILSSLLLIVCISPFFVKNFIDTKISEQKLILKDKGLAFNIDSSSGYFSSIRTYKLKIEDINKFKSYFKSLIPQDNKQAAFLADLLSKNEKDLELLSELILKGEIKNSNLNPFSKIKANLYIDSLSDKFLSLLNTNEEFETFLLSKIEKKVLVLNFLFSSSLELELLSLKDIKEQIKIDAKDAFLLVLNKVKYKKVSFSKASFSIKEFQINSLLSNNDFNFFLKDLNSKTTVLSEFENSTNLSLESIFFDSKENSFSLKDIKLDSKGEIKNKLYDVVSLLSFKNLKLKGKNSLEIESFALDFSLRNFVFLQIEKLFTSYSKINNLAYDFSMNKKEKEQKTAQYSMDLINSFKELLNAGFSFDLNSKLNKVKSTKLNLDGISIIANTVFKKNSLSLNDLNKQNELLKFLKGRANLSLSKKDIKVISLFIPLELQSLLSYYKKEEKEKVVFDFNMDNGKIKVNNKNFN